MAGFDSLSHNQRHSTIRQCLSLYQPKLHARWQCLPLCYSQHHTRWQDLTLWVITNVIVQYDSVCLCINLSFTQDGSICLWVLLNFIEVGNRSPIQDLTKRVVSVLNYIRQTAVFASVCRIQQHTRRLCWRFLLSFKIVLPSDVIKPRLVPLGHKKVKIKYIFQHF